jgi:hypothetical protein
VDGGCVADTGAGAQPLGAAAPHSARTHIGLIAIVLRNMLFECEVSPLRLCLRSVGYLPQSLIFRNFSMGTCRECSEVPPRVKQYLQLRDGGVSALRRMGESPRVISRFFGAFPAFGECPTTNEKHRLEAVSSL